MDKVSIIIPIYNAENFLEDTINSVKNQTYKNWELILVNDKSTDNSKKIAKKYLNKNIKWIDLEENSGAAIARNKGISAATGDYLCFLDADDFWDEDKLEKQVKFMEKNNYDFTFTSYQFVDEKGAKNGKKVIVPIKINYKEALKNTTISTSTVMFNMKKLSKEDIYMPNLRRGQDTATWWKVLKKIDYAYGLKDVFSYYRRTKGTLSSNKIIALKRTWNLYRNVEKLSVLKSLYYFMFYCLNAIKRRI